MERRSDLQGSLNYLLDLALPFAVHEGVNPTSADYLAVIKRCRPSTPMTGVLNPAFCLILQGTKVVSYQHNLVECSRGDFLASVVELPAVVHVANATRVRPYIGLKVEFPLEDIAQMIAESGIRLKAQAASDPARFVGKANEELVGIVEKILGLSSSPEDQFRAKLLKRDLIFSLLSGSSGHLFFPRAVFDEKVGLLTSLTWLRTSFRQPLSVERLARMSNMSVSGLHHKFKALTSMGPLQYQKLLRLHEARRLLIAGSHDVTTTAYEVGYESPSQFSREYRRMFGLPPTQDVKELRALLAPSSTELVPS